MMATRTSIQNVEQDSCTRRITGASPA
jgi:hypothetical protein